MVACSDNDEPKIPSNAISLNMMNDGNGKTTIGGSDVYINSSNNFESDYCGIIDLGRKGSFSQNPDLTQIAQEVAVTPGNYYQIVLARDVLTVAGQRAFPVNSNYYNVYVDSWLYGSDNEISGAKVSYAECYPAVNELPEWGSSFPIYMKSEDNHGESATYTFAKGVEVSTNYSIYDFEGSNLKQYLKVNIAGNKIVFYNTAYGTYNGKVEMIVNVRYKSLYTQVRFIVSSSF